MYKNTKVLVNGNKNLRMENRKNEQAIEIINLLVNRQNKRVLIKCGTTPGKAIFIYLEKGYKFLFIYLFFG